MSKAKNNWLAFLKSLSLSIFFRASLMWVGLCGLAFINGTFRELILKSTFGMVEPMANQVSCLTGVVIWSAFTILFWSRLKVRSWREARILGIGWFLGTIIFETFILDRKLSWTKILATFDLSAGQLWSLVLIWIGLMPVGIFSVLRLRHYINNWGATTTEQTEPIHGVQSLRFRI